MAQPKPTTFIRNATGLVRDISPLDSFLANFGNLNIPIGLLAFITAPYIFPGSDPVLATLLATVLAIAPALAYTFLTWIMPRSGGDYVFISRTLHPGLGFVVNFALAFWAVAFVGIYANWITTLILGPSLLVIGTVTSNSGIIGLANGPLVQPIYITLIGLVFIAILALLLIRGTRTTFLAVKVASVIEFIGIAVGLGLLATNSNANFIADFNHFASYTGVISSAHSAGYSPVGPNNFLATLGVIPLAWGTLAFGVYSSYWGGESKSVKKNALLGILGSTIIGGVILAIIGVLAIHVFGYDFLGSITSLAYTGSKAYPFFVSPYFNLFASMLTTNPIVLWILALGYIAVFFVNAIALFFMATRSVFAWSFDRVIPSKLSDVSQRYHTPVLATVILVFSSIILLLVYTFQSTTTLGIVAGSGLAFTFLFSIAFLAAVILPFRRKSIFESSPAKIKVGGVPLISIVGVIAIAYYAMVFWFFVSNRLYGANIPVTYETISVSIITPIVLFLVSYFYRKSSGFDLLLPFKEIPPE